MDLNEITWGYIPILIAIIEILISLNIFRSKKSLKNIILTFLIIIINGASIYILIQMMNKAWPSYLPHVGIGFSTILFLTLWVKRKN